MTKAMPKKKKPAKTSTAKAAMRNIKSMGASTNSASQSFTKKARPKY